MGGNGDILKPHEMLELAKTEAGKRILFAYIISARIGYAVQNIFELLDIVPSPGVQHQVCELIYNTLFRVPQEQIFQWCDEVSKWKEEEYHEGVC